MSVSGVGTQMRIASGSFKPIEAVRGLEPRGTHLGDCRVGDLLDVRLPGVELGDLTGVDVEAEDAKTGRGERAG